MGLAAGAGADFLAGMAGFLAAAFAAGLAIGFALGFATGAFAARVLAAGLGGDFAGAAALRSGATTFFAWADTRLDLPAPLPLAWLLPDALVRAGAFIPDNSPAALARSGWEPAPFRQPWPGIPSAQG
jgi:hypothetical protein